MGLRVFVGEIVEILFKQIDKRIPLCLQNHHTYFFLKIRLKKLDKNTKILRRKGHFLSYFFSKDKIEKVPKKALEWPLKYSLA